jgi:hypothetical protein
MLNHAETHSKPADEESNTKPHHDEPNTKSDQDETNVKPDLKECFTFDVGYSNPPRDSWFVKGISGNPDGRPKGSKNKPKKLTDKNFNEILRDQLFKQVKLKGDRKATVSAVTAVTQSMMDLAIGGNVRAIQLVFASIRSVEAADAAQQEADYNYAVAYKARWNDATQSMFDGPDRPQPVPNPQHIILDDRNRRVMFAGPRNEEEKIKYLAGEDLREEDIEEESDNANPSEDGYPEEKYYEPLPYRRETSYDGEQTHYELEEPRLRTHPL